MGELRQRERRVRGGFGGLADHRASRGERRRNLPGDHRRREIPRGDRRADADGLLDRQQPPVVADGRDHLAVDAPRLFGEPLGVRRADRDLGPGLGERLALFGGHDQREVLGVRELKLRPFAQNGAALLRGLEAPRGPRPVGGLDRAARLGGAHDRDGADPRAGRRIVDVVRRTAVGIGPTAVDIALLPEQRGILEAERRAPGEGVGGHGGGLLQDEK